MSVPADNPQHIIVVSSLVRNATGHVLLIRHRKRGWEIPQGKVEEGESVLHALHREVMEETGVEVELEALAAIWSKLSKPTAIIFTFLARYTGGDLRPSLESPELGWFPEDEALTLVSHPVNHDRLKTLLNFSGAVVYRAYTPNPYQVHAEDTLSSAGDLFAASAS
ncbi:MAG: NUDIX hydrolase [Geobacter sp.]|nr:MAG: NUDIX hydrolase [Geobacter sp.]